LVNDLIIKHNLFISLLINKQQGKGKRERENKTQGQTVDK